MPDPKTSEAIGWVLICVAAACFALHQITQFIRSWLPRPSASEVRDEALDKFIPRAEIAPRLQKIESNIEEVGRRITVVDSTRRDSEQALRDVIHAMELRILSAGEKRQTEIIAHIDRLTSEIFIRLGRAEPAIAANSADIENIKEDVTRLQVSHLPR